MNYIQKPKTPLKMEGRFLTQYLFTDGFADQFGGPKGKKYKYKQLSELILIHATKEMAEQKSILENAFDKWKGKLEQVDDVSVIGIRL